MAKSLVNRDNYIVVQGWMIAELKLKGNELLIYACIYGFSQLEGQYFTGSLQYLADWTNTTKRNVIYCLKSLVEKGYLEKKENIINGVKFCEYNAIKFPSSEKSSLEVVKKVHLGSEKNSPDVVKKFHEGSEKSSHNNIDNNINNNLVNNIGVYDRAHTPAKYKFGKYENVYLTDVEYESMTTELGNELRDECIAFFSSYIHEKGGYNSDSHYETINRWVIDAVKERKQKALQCNTNATQTQQPKGRQYDMAAVERSLLKAQNPPATAGTDPAIKAKAEDLQQRLSS